MSWTGGPRGGKRARTIAVRNRAARTSSATARAVRARYAPKMASRKAPVKGAIAPFGGRTELKYVDTDLTGGTMVCDTTGNANPLNLIAVGDDNTTRDGRQVNIVSIQIKGRVNPIDAITNPVRCRVAIVWDNANNSASPTAAQLIAAVYAAADSTSFPLVDNANRFTILWDSAYVLGNNANTATQAISPHPGAHLVDYYKRINQVTQFSGTTAAIGSIQNGALWMITLGDQAANAGGLFIGRVRVRFTDP